MSVGAAMPLALRTGSGHWHLNCTPTRQCGNDLNRRRDQSSQGRGAEVEASTLEHMTWSGGAPAPVYTPHTHRHRASTHHNNRTTADRELQVQVKP
jgi:hypothetical protein